MYRHTPCHTVLLTLYHRARPVRRFRLSQGDQKSGEPYSTRQFPALHTV